MNTKWTGFIEGLASGVGGLPAAYQRGQQISETSRKRRGLKDYQEGMEELLAEYNQKRGEGMPVSKEDFARREKLLETNVRPLVNMFYDRAGTYDPTKGHKGVYWRFKLKNGEYLGNHIYSLGTPFTPKKMRDKGHWEVIDIASKATKAKATVRAKGAKSRIADTKVYANFQEKSLKEQERSLHTIEEIAKTYGGKVKKTSRYNLLGFGFGETYYIEIDGKAFSPEDLKKLPPAKTKKPWE